MSNDLQNIFIRVKTHSTLGGLMKNETLIEFVKEKYYEQKMSAEYELQLTKIIELEKKFTKDFSKNKWREYFNLYLSIGDCILLKLTKSLLKQLKLYQIIILISQKNNHKAHPKLCLYLNILLIYSNLFLYFLIFLLVFVSFYKVRQPSKFVELVLHQT